MINNSANSKRIAKNTLLLYVRMLLTMFISLYTSRVILNALGVEDFGIYNVVGGIVSMFAILSGSLSAAISRFITFELGKEDFTKLKSIFSAAITIQLLLALIIIILAETIGLWFLNSKMNIPENRMFAANWVFQFSIVTFSINLISVPYNAAIIAHEKMAIFAYISIIEVIGKLLIAYFILISPIDKLIFYAILMCILAVVIRIIYGIYCKRHFVECNYQFTFNRTLLKQLFSFAGWNFIGASSAVLRDQGGNILINLFAGPTVNAARGIAFQVYHAVQSFVSNFMIALNPQITKSYASKDYSYMMLLIHQGARLSFYMLLLLSLPILINTSFILNLWLKDVPAYTVLFVQLTLIFAMSESLSNPLITAQLATGNIRNYQIIVGGIQMLNLPISYLFLHFKFTPTIVFIIAIFISQCCLGARLYMMRTMIKLNTKMFLKDVYANTIIVASLSFFISFFIKSFFEDSSLANFIISSIITFLITLFIEIFIGCSTNERIKLLKFIERKLKK